MIASVQEQLLVALDRLRADPPPTLLNRVVTRWTAVPGPLGELYVAFTARGISYVRTAESVHSSADTFIAKYHQRFARPLRHVDAAPAGLLPALRSGRSRSLRYDLDGVSDFERQVLEAALRIPAGQTRPYAWIAAEIGRPRAVRAVGSALGRNPVPVLIPCHRVTRSGGELGEYVFGAQVKEELLRAENLDLDGVRLLARRQIHYLGSDTTGIVCYPTCAHARRISEAHRRGFRRLADAAAAGYRPCLACRPAAGVSA